VHSRTPPLSHELIDGEDAVLDNAPEAPADPRSDATRVRQPPRCLPLSHDLLDGQNTVLDDALRID